jgi:ABC-type transporter MlaC component
MRIALALLLLLPLVLLHSAPARAQDKDIAAGNAAPAEDARQAAGKEQAEVLGEARKYIALLKSSKPAEALETCWDLDAMFASIFGKDVEQHSKDERAEMKRALIKLVSSAYDDPRIVEAMRAATVRDLKAQPPKDGVILVSFTMVLGETELPNVLHFRKSGNAWRVIDGGVNGRLMIPSFKQGYDSVRGKLTPLHFVREVTKPQK